MGIFPQKLSFLSTKKFFDGISVLTEKQLRMGGKTHLTPKPVCYDQNRRHS
jgi:hypothetical protein